MQERLLSLTHSIGLQRFRIVLEGEVRSVLYLPDGAAVVCGMAGGWVKIVNAVDGAYELQVHPHMANIDALAMHPNGTSFASGMPSRYLYKVVTPFQ